MNTDSKTLSVAILTPLDCLEVTEASVRRKRNVRTNVITSHKIR